MAKKKRSGGTKGKLMKAMKGKAVKKAKAGR